MSKIVPLFKSKNVPGQVKDVLNQLMEKMNMTISQLSKNTGLAGTTIKRICTDPDSNPTLISITRIADFFSITPDQLMGIAPLKQEQNSYSPNFEQWSKIPIISTEQAIFWPETMDEIQSSGNGEYILTDVEANSDTFAMIINNDSLEPKFSEGTTFIIDPQRAPKNKDIVLLLEKGKKLPYFRKVFIDGPDLYAKPINPDLINIPPLSGKHFRIIGTVIQAKSNFI